MADNSKKYPVRGVTKSGVETEKLLEKMIRDHADLSAQQATQNSSYDTDITNINTDITTINTSITTINSTITAIKNIPLLSLSAYAGADGAELFDKVHTGASAASLADFAIYIPAWVTSLKFKLRMSCNGVCTYTALCGGQSVGPITITNASTVAGWEAEATIATPTVGWQTFNVTVTDNGFGTHIYGIVVRGL